MNKRSIAIIIICIVVVAIALGIAQYLRGLSHDARTYPGPDNTNGPAEGGALETGGALDQKNGYQQLPARDMPHTVASSPPSGPDSDDKVPPQPK